MSARQGRTLLGYAPALALAATAAVLAPVAVGAPVSDALDRPAVMSRQAEHSVLLGAARAGERIVAVGERGVAVLSDDGGRHWRQAPIPVSVTLTAVRFADPKRGIAVGHGGTVLMTDDGGQSWTRRLDGRAIARLALDAARAGGNDAAIREAERLVADGPDKPLLDALMLDAQRALVVGAYGLAFATEDGGRHWVSWMARMDNPKGMHLYAARRHGSVLLLAGEQGLVLRSDDGGRSFRRLHLPYNGSFFTAELLSGDELVVAGLRGNVWRSRDGGVSWSRIEAPVPVSIVASTITSRGALWMANQAGLVLELDGDRLVPVYEGRLPPLNGLLAEGNGEILALTMQGAMTLPVDGTQGARK